MSKEDLLNEAEASGLCRTNLRPDKLHGAHGSVQSSANMWYCGWNCMSSLIQKELVVKWSNPAKFMITEDGFKIALECMARSGLISKDHQIEWVPPVTTSTQRRKAKDRNIPLENMPCPTSFTALPLQGPGKKQRENPVNVTDPKGSSNLGISAGTEEHVSFEIDLGSEDEFSLMRNVTNILIKQNQAQEKIQERHETVLASGQDRENGAPHVGGPKLLETGRALNSSSHRGGRVFSTGLCLPPLNHGESFKNEYDIVICLDNLEKFEIKGGERKASRFADLLSQQYCLIVELKRLPVGDVLWIARSKKDPKLEYVLDFILERKRVDDLWHSIKSKRFRDQKLRLLACGVKKVFYLIEGDPDTQEAAMNIKTAGYQTEIEEGFDVQRTLHWNGEGSTVQRYAGLTMAIRDRYAMEIGKESCSVRPAMTFNEFREQCNITKELSVGSFFGSILSQIHSVTEDVALTIMERYPTLPALVQAYQQLAGNRREQETLLTSLSVKNKKITELVSKRIFERIWS